MPESLELNKIYCCNALDLMARMPDGFIDLTVTSPPYDNLRTYNGYEFDFEPIARELYRVTKKGGVVVWVVGDATVNGSETGTSFRQALYFKEIGFNLHDTMIYQKIGGGACGSSKSYWQGFEYMFVFSSDEPETINRIADRRNVKAGQLMQKTVGGRSPKYAFSVSADLWEIADYGTRTNIWNYHAGNNGDDFTGTHTAPFPESLAKDHILSWSNENDLVYDPFMGSGTTAKAAHQLKRRWIGSEISSEYVDLANKRLEPYLAQNSLF